VPDVRPREHKPAGVRTAVTFADRTPAAASLAERKMNKRSPGGCPILPGWGTDSNAANVTRSKPPASQTAVSLGQGRIAA